MTDPRAETPRLAPIQALRGIAAAMIVLLHAFHEAALPKPGFPLKMGVDIFFVISGFIMVYTSRTRFGQEGAWRGFIARRLLRIVPIYWIYTTALVGIALALPAALQTARIEPRHLALSYAFIPHESPAGRLHPFLEVGWTLNYEMMFYVVFAALLFLPARRMLTALTLGFGAAVIAGAWLPPGHGALHFWTRPIILGFVGGAWIGHAFVSGRRLPGAAIVLAPAVIAALFAYRSFPATLQPWTLQAGAILLVALAVLPGRMASRPVPGALRALGDASYSVYLAHPFILAATALALRDLAPWARCALGAAAALVGGYALYRLVELPALGMSRRLLSRVGGPGAGAPSAARAPGWAARTD